MNDTIETKKNIWTETEIIDLLGSNGYRNTVATKIDYGYRIKINNRLTLTYFYKSGKLSILGPLGDDDLAKVRQLFHQPAFYP